MRALVALALVGAIAAPASAQQASQLPVDAGICSVAAGGVALVTSSTGDAKMYNAGIYMIAARDAEACQAMYVAGLVTDCVDKKGRSTVRAEQQPILSSNSGAALVQVGYSKCDYDRASNRLTIKYKSGADKPTAKAACLASYGF